MVLRSGNWKAPGERPCGASGVAAGGYGRCRRGARGRSGCVPGLLARKHGRPQLDACQVARDGRAHGRRRRSPTMQRPPGAGQGAALRCQRSAVFLARAHGWGERGAAGAIAWVGRSHGQAAGRCGLGASRVAVSLCGRAATSRHAPGGRAPGGCAGAWARSCLVAAQPRWVGPAAHGCGGQSVGWREGGCRRTGWRAVARRGGVV